MKNDSYTSGKVIKQSRDKKKKFSLPYPFPDSPLGPLPDRFLNSIQKYETEKEMRMIKRKSADLGDREKKKKEN